MMDTSCEVHTIHKDLSIESTNGIQASEVDEEINGDLTNQHLSSINQNIHPTNQDLDVDLTSADLLDDELSDLISEAKKCLLRQSEVCDDDCFVLNRSANDYIVPDTNILNEGNKTQCIKVNNNIDSDNGLISADIVSNFEELNLKDRPDPEVQDLDTSVPDLKDSVLDSKDPVSGSKYTVVDSKDSTLDSKEPDSKEPVSETSESTDTTPRNSSSTDDTSEVEEGDINTMRWKKKGDHPEYSKEEFMEEYSQVRQTREKNGDSKRSRKKDSKAVEQAIIKNLEACGMGSGGMGRELRQSNGRNSDVQRVTELPNGSPERPVVDTREAICKSQASHSGFGGGFFIAPPKPPRIQSQLSESAVASHLQQQPNAHRTARSMSLPAPPPKPRRSVNDGKVNEAENCLFGNTTPVNKKESQVTKSSIGHQNGSVKTGEIPSHLITSQVEEVDEVYRDSEITVDHSIISTNCSDVRNTLIRSRATESSSVYHPDHQPPREMGNNDNGLACGNVILRNKQKPPADFPDDGFLRDDITSNQDNAGLTSSISAEDGSDDEQYFDGDMHLRGWTWVYIGDNAELSARLENEGQEYRNTTKVKDSSNDDTSSISTTASEKEFKIQVTTSIKRKCSEIDYQRVSMFVRNRDICLKKKNGVFGFRIQRSRPVVVTEVDEEGAAEEAGIKVGDVIVSINGNDVSSAAHSDVVKLASCTNANDHLTLVVGTNVCNSLNLGSDKPVLSGYMYKRGGTGLMQSWKKRWFVLKHDNCLYYYKTEHDVDPLGAIVLASYTVVKAWDLDKPFAFKLKKFKARTYYLHTTSEDERNKWAFAITEATNTSVKSNIWMGISTHNVSIPALSITNPECIGYLTKRGDRHKTWRRRFFVLKDACIYYYENNSSPTALGVVHFHGYTIQEIRSNSKKFPFDLIAPEPDLRTYHFQADHETDRKRWVAALASSIGKWIRTDVCNSDDDEGCEMLI